MKHTSVNARILTDALTEQVDTLWGTVHGKQLAAMLADGGFPETETAELKKAIDKVEDLIAELSMTLLMPFDEYSVD